MKAETKENIKYRLLKLSLSLVGVVLFTIIAVVSSRGEVKIYKQDDTIELDGVEYEIVKLEKNEDELDDDNNDLKVTIKITNNSKKTVEYSKLNYFLINRDGEEVTKPGLARDDGTFLGSGELEPGEEVKGAISWTVKKNAKDLRIRYYKNSFFSKDNEFEFQWELDY